MNDFVIIPDSSCDLPADLRQRFDIPDYLHGTVYFPDGRTEYADLDWGIISPEDFYKSMSGRNVLYKTSTFTEQEGYEVYEKYLKQGKDILSISLSSALSGTYSLCLRIAEDLMKKYPGRKIICIDSLRYSTSMALLTVLAGQKRQEGATIEETADYINNLRGCIHQMGPMDDLFFLVKTGRISNFKALFGTLVGVNPMADFNAKGLAEVIVKFKGKRTALDATVKYMKETIVNPEENIVFVAHSNRLAAADTLAEMIRKEINPKEVIITHVGMACGPSIGPGLCAAFYLGKPISEGLVEEKAIMQKIAGK